MKDLIEFFVYLRDNCYNRDFQIEPQRVVEQFYEWKSNKSNIEIKKESNPSIDRLLDDNNEPFDKISDANYLAESYDGETVIVVTKDGDKLCKSEGCNAWQLDGRYEYCFYEVKNNAEQKEVEPVSFPCENHTPYWGVCGICGQY